MAEYISPSNIEYKSQFTQVYTFAVPAAGIVRTELEGDTLNVLGLNAAATSETGLVWAELSADGEADDVKVYKNIEVEAKTYTLTLHNDDGNSYTLRLLTTDGETDYDGTELFYTVTIRQSANQVITVWTDNGTAAHTETFSCRKGTAYSVTVQQDAGYFVGTPNITDGVVTGDVEIFATAAVKKKVWERRVALLSKNTDNEVVIDLPRTAVDQVEGFEESCVAYRQATTLYNQQGSFYFDNNSSPELLAEIQKEIGSGFDFWGYQLGTYNGDDKLQVLGNGSTVYWRTVTNDGSIGTDGAGDTWTDWKSISLTTDVLTKAEIQSLITSAVNSSASSLESSLSSAVSSLESEIAKAGITASSIGANGYVKFSNGLILQWGSISTSGLGYTSATFPISFTTPLCLMHSYLRPTSGSRADKYMGYHSFTATGVTLGHDGSKASFLAIGI